MHSKRSSRNWRNLCCWIIERSQHLKWKDRFFFEKNVSPSQTSVCGGWKSMWATMKFESEEFRDDWKRNSSSIWSIKWRDEWIKDPSSDIERERFNNRSISEIFTNWTEKSSAEQWNSSRMIIERKSSSDRLRLAGNNARQDPFWGKTVTSMRDSFHKRRNHF